MWSHWSYKQDSPPDLEQGDVLRPSDELRGLLQTYHPHYAAHEKNLFYVVLTQSCDLVRRAGPCAARYIALAPVRSLRYIVELEYGAKIQKLDGATYANTRIRGDVERFLARLFNNNESSYYYLEQEQAAGLAEPMCAMLALPIAFKNEHYETFLAARVIGIDDAFQAKLGSSLGQMYSRVGTKDFTQEQVKSKIGEITDRLTLWLDVAETDALERLVADYRIANPGVLIDSNVLDSLVSKVPKKKTVAIERILEIATQANLIANPSKERFQFRRSLENDAAFTGLFR